MANRNRFVRLLNFHGLRRLQKNTSLLCIEAQHQRALSALYPRFRHAFFRDLTLRRVTTRAFQSAKFVRHNTYVQYQQHHAVTC